MCLVSTKDTCEESFPSMKVARLHAACSTTVLLFHYIWLVGLSNRRNDINADVAPGIADPAMGNALAVSRSKEEIEKLSEKPDEAQQETWTNERKSMNREI